MKHPSHENANFAPSTKCQKSIEDSSKKLNLQPFNKISVSVGNDTPSARTTFFAIADTLALQNRALVGGLQRSTGSRPLPAYTPGSCQARACNLSSSSLRVVKLDQLDTGTCQVRAWNSSSSNQSIVRFDPDTCQVRGWRLSSSSLELVTFAPGACYVRAWNLSSWSLEVVKFELASWQVRAWN